MSRAAPNQPHWASIGESGALLGMRFMFWLYRWFGRIPFRIALYPVILYYFLFRRTARESSLEYLRNLEQAGRFRPRGALWRESYRHFMNFGEGLLDKLAVWQGDVSLDQITFHNYHHIDALVAEGRGAVMVVSHLGNLEICRALVHRHRSMTMNVLMHTHHAGKFNEMLKQAGSDSQMNIIQASDVGPATAMLLNEKVAQGEFVVIAADRVPVVEGDNTRQVEFLGQPCEFPIGGFILASLLRCPVLTLFCLRDEAARGKPRWNLIIERFADQITLPRKARMQALDDYLQQWADRLADACEQAPLQWYNFYPFWRLKRNAEHTE